MNIIKTKMDVFLVLLVVVIMVVGLWGYLRRCHGLVLPHGYTMIKEGPRTVVIEGPSDRPRVYQQGEGFTSYSSTVIGPRIDQIAVFKIYILGHTVHPKGSVIGELSRPGWFLINSESGEILDGLSRSKWESEIRGRGISTQHNFCVP